MPISAGLQQITASFASPSPIKHPVFFEATICRLVLLLCNRGLNLYVGETRGRWR